MPKRLLCLTLGVALSACSLVPAYQRPELPIPASWSTRPPEQTTTASATSEWWRSFGTAELDKLMIKGLGSNFNLQAAYSKVEQARGGAQVAAANRYPSVGIAAATGQGKPTVLGQASYEVDFWG
ncbi:MAG: outer membrane protein multidrug efflux system, partial [Betaproteobacteria bacterium]|nr:outer membrane protein multidrug efflux system [Betaproteobacteria bacterium]